MSLENVNVPGEAGKHISFAASHLCLRFHVFFNAVCDGHTESSPGTLKRCCQEESAREIELQAELATFSHETLLHLTTNCRVPNLGLWWTS